MNSELQQQAQTLLDYLALPSATARHGADNVALMALMLTLDMNSVTPDEAAERINGDIQAITRILKS